MIKICKDIIIAVETVELLYMHANGINFETVKNDCIRRYVAKRDDAWKQSVCKKTAALTKIMAEVCSELDSKDSTLQYYFCGYSSAATSTKCCLAQIITWILGAYDADYDTHMRKLKDSWRNKIANNDPIMLSPGMSLQYAKDVPWAIDIAENIDGLQYPEEFRWRIFKLISNTDVYVDELAKFMRPIAIKLEKALLACQTEFEDGFGYWEEFFKSRTLKEFAHLFCNVDCDVPNNNVIIYINRINSMSVVSEMEVNGTDYWYIHIGCLIDGEISYATNSMTTEEICDVLKVLSDKSKYKILQTVSSVPAYGTELADQLGLTNATISRHMNALFNLGLITAEKKNAKIYYTTNKERLAKFLKTLCDELLKNKQ